MEEAVRMGRQIIISSKKGDFNYGNAQALPTYAMSCFKLRNGLCHDIEALDQKKFWGQRGEG